LKANQALVRVYGNTNLARPLAVRSDNIQAAVWELVRPPIGKPDLILWLIVMVAVGDERIKRR
jgi:thymidylate kinase